MLAFQLLKPRTENFRRSIGALVLLDELYQFSVLVGTEPHKVLFVGLGLPAVFDFGTRLSY